MSRFVLPPLLLQSTTTSHTYKCYEIKLLRVNVEGASRHKSMGRLVDQSTKSVGRLTRKISWLTKQSCRFTEPTGSYFVTVCNLYILGC